MISDILYYTHNKYGIQSNIDRHQIRFHELTFLLDGKMTYYINDEQFDMVNGDVIYIPAGSLRQRNVGQGANNYISINFHSAEDLPFKYYMPNNVNEEIRLLLNYLDKIHRTSSEGATQKLIYALEVLVLQIADNLQNVDKPPLAIEIANYLELHYRQRISLSDISSETFFSVAYCESEFRKAFGKSIIHYLIDIRLSEAKSLLLETSLTCSAIADLVGFDDNNYFSRVFKKRIGCSPLEFRKTAYRLDRPHL